MTRYRAAPSAGTVAWITPAADIRKDFAPPTTTGSKTAKGVAFPVRPIETIIPFRRVVFSSGGNL